MNKTEIQLRERPAEVAHTRPTPGSLLPDPDTLATVERLSEYVMESGEYAKRFRNKAQAIMVMLRGNNLGITFDAALDHVYVVHGKTGISGQLMLRLIYERVQGATVEFDTAVDVSKVCVVTMARPGHSPQKFSFSIEEADAAGITRNRDGSPNTVWKAYRQDMLRWRAVARGARVVFPDAIQGCWLQSELDESQSEPAHYISATAIAQDSAEVAGKHDEPEPAGYSIGDMRLLLKEYNHKYNCRLSYRKACEELIGLVVPKDVTFGDDEINALCEFLSGALVVEGEKSNG